jgi:hypothetical protein
MFGYLTALFATFLIDREAKDLKPEIARQKSIQEIKDEIVQLRRLIEDSITHPPKEEQLNQKKNKI